MTTLALAAAAAFACSLDRKSFGAALALADKVTEAKNTIPILSTVRLELAGDVLTVEATDLDFIIRQPVAVEDATAGAICIDLKALRATVKKMTGGRVRLQDIGGRVMVTDCDTGGAARLATLPAADWPCNINPVEPAAAFTFDADQFACDLARVRPAISTEETRYYLNGVHFHAARVTPPAARSAYHDAAADELEVLKLEQYQHDRAAAEGGDGQDDPEAVEARTARIAELGAICKREEAERCAPDALRMVATDGHRLHYVTRPLHADMRQLPPVILPRKAVAVALAIMGKKPSGDVAVEFTDARFSLRFGDVELRGKLIDGTFPDYTRVIPTQNGKRLTIHADQLVTLVQSATAHCTDKTRSVKLSLCPDSVIFSATSPETGTAAVQAPALSPDNIIGAEFTGEEMAIGFNAAYLTATAAAFGGPMLTVELDDSAAPTLFRVEGNPYFAAVLMPMRLGEAIMRPIDIERLNRTPFDNFAADIGGAIANAEQLSARPLRGISAPVRKSMQTQSRTAWQEVARLVATGTEFLKAGSVTAADARAMVRSIILQATGREAEAARLETIRTATPSGSFAALAGTSPAVAPPAVQPMEEAETCEIAQVDVPDVQPLAEYVADMPALAAAEPLEPHGEDEAPDVQPDALAALAARVAALEDMLAGQGKAPAEISPPDPTVQDLAPDERAELVAEIDRLRATVAGQAVTIDRLRASRPRTHARLVRMRAALKRERAMTSQLLGQVGDMLKRREPPEPDAVPVAIPLPASILPPVIAMPAVASRPRREPVEA